LRKWLLIAPLENITAMVSFEMQATSPPPYSDETVRTAFATLTSRAAVPDNEQLMLVPFRISDTAGLRLVRVVPGVAAQFTDGPKDTIEALDQPQLIIAAAGGGPQQLGDRDQFARNALDQRPPMKDLRISSSESMRSAARPATKSGRWPRTRRPAPRSRSCNGCASAPAPTCGSSVLRRRKAGRQPSRAFAPCATGWSRDSASIQRLLRDNGYCRGLSLAVVACAGWALAPPLDTATSAGRSIRSPIR
jgi:hypothetical protein